MQDHALGLVFDGEEVNRTLPETAVGVSTMDQNMILTKARLLRDAGRAQDYFELCQKKLDEFKDMLKQEIIDRTNPTVLVELASTVEACETIVRYAAEARDAAYDRVMEHFAGDENHE